MDTIMTNTPIESSGMPLYYIKDSKAHPVCLGYVFKHRRSGRRFRFDKEWEGRAMWSHDAMNFDVRRVHCADGMRRMAYVVSPVWEIEQTSPEEMMSIAKAAIETIVGEILPPGTEIGISIRLPLPVDHIKVNLDVESVRKLAQEDLAIAREQEKLTREFEKA